MFMHALEHYRQESEWIAFLDIDEFLKLPGTNNIQTLLNRTPPEVHALHFNWSFFGNSFHVERPTGSVLCTYTRREEKLHLATKTMTRAARIDPARITGKLQFWHHWGDSMGADFRACNVLGDLFDQVRGTDEGERYTRSREIQHRIRDVAVINHYAFKSIADFERRFQRGLLGEFTGQAMWKRVHDDGTAKKFLESMNAVEDTYLADYWRHFLRAGEAARIVPAARLPSLARGKPADQSSIGALSRGATTAEDAAGVVNGQITGAAQCHTAQEDRPWWSVDLGASCLVYEIRLFNRVDDPSLRQRLGAFRIETAGDDDAWGVVCQNDGDTTIGGADGHPLIVRVTQPFVVRRLRVTALGHTSLQLDQVEVYGVPVV
jgi:hypothetical protein